MLELFTGRHGRVAAGLLVGEFVSAMQALVVATVMPRVVADLHGLALYGAVFASFLIAQFVFLPFAGPWADRYGTRRILTIAFALLAAGLTLSSQAHSMLQLVLARFIEGSGAGMDYAVSFTAIVKTFPERQRAQMFSLISTAWIVPAILAPTIGAVIATAFGWRWVFLGFVPLVALASVLILPSLSDERAAQSVDPFGALRMLFSRATLLLRGRNSAFVAFGLLHASFLGADAYVALNLTAVRGLPLTSAGLCITLGALGWSSAALLQPALMRRVGARLLVAAGAAACVIAAIGMITVATGGSVALAFVAWFAGGAGVGLAYPTISLVGVADVDEGGEGAVSSAMLLAAMLGMAIGVVLCGIPVGASERWHFPLAHALVYTFAVAAAGAIALGATVARLPNRRD